MLTPIINVCHPLKTYGLCLTMKKWKPHCWRRRATSRVYQHTVSNITLCYTREQAVNTPLSLERTTHGQWHAMTQQASWALTEQHHTGKSLLCLLHLCNKSSEVSVSLSSAANFVLRYKDVYCNISYGPSPSLAHSVPGVPKFSSRSFTLTSQKRNLQIKTKIKHLTSLQDF